MLTPLLIYLNKVFTATVVPKTLQNNFLTFFQCYLRFRSADTAPLSLKTKMKNILQLLYFCSFLRIWG